MPRSAQHTFPMSAYAVALEPVLLADAVGLSSEIDAKLPDCKQAPNEKGTTHIIIGQELNLPSLSRRKQQIVLSAAWLEDCLARQEKIDPAKYLIHLPELSEPGLRFSAPGHQFCRCTADYFAHRSLVHTMQRSRYTAADAPSSPEPATTSRSKLHRFARWLGHWKPEYDQFRDELQLVMQVSMLVKSCRALCFARKIPLQAQTPPKFSSSIHPSG